MNLGTLIIKVIINEESFELFLILLLEWLIISRLWWWLSSHFLNRRLGIVLIGRWICWSLPCEWLNSFWNIIASIYHVPLLLSIVFKFIIERSFFRHACIFLIKQSGINSIAKPVRIYTLLNLLLRLSLPDRAINFHWWLRNRWISLPKCLIWCLFF